MTTTRNLQRYFSAIICCIVVHSDLVVAAFLIYRFDLQSS